MTYSRTTVRGLRTTNKSRRPEVKGAKAIEVTQAAKITDLSATYASQSTCDTSCKFLDNGCYAEVGPVSWQKPDKPRSIDPIEVTKNEAEHIRYLTGRRPLRLHVVGDAYNTKCAEILAEASQEHIDKHGMPVFTFTHSWRHVPRKAWGNISVLASCETMEDVLQARERGYATAIVRPDPPTQAKAIKYPDGSKELPCVSETRNVPCIQCGLCMNDRQLHKERISIRFYAHGSRKTTVINTLRRLEQ
jgi:hypothetical protein